MMEQKFQLYTWQHPDWDITKDKRDPSKVSLAWEGVWDTLEPLYMKLEKEIGTRDFVWCFPEYEYWRDNEIRELWKLDMASSGVLAVLKTSTWNKLRKMTPTDELYEGIFRDELFLEGSEGIQRLSKKDKGIQVLIRVPHCNSTTVIDRSRFSKGIYNGDVEYENLHTSECEARKCLEEEKTRWIRK